MILLVHIAAALSSIMLATYTFIAPSKFRLRLSGILAGFTLASGTYLVINAHAQMLEACMSGLAYLLGVSCLMILARNKLAKAAIRK